MSKRSLVREARLFGGVDVSAATLAVAVAGELRAGYEEREFANTGAGHRQLVAWLLKLGEQVRVSLEATGIYSLDLALALDAAGGIEVAVLNPKTANRFAQTLRRSKTDRADAIALAEYSRRMPFTPWQRPNGQTLQLRALGRHIATLSEDHARLSNRLHAAKGSRTTPSCVRDDLKKAMSDLKKRILRLRQEAVAMIGQEAEMKRKFQQLIALPGIAATNAVQILGELAGLDPEMTVRQWVAHSGLDPVHQSSGTSVKKASHISRQGSRHLRKALFMAALTAARHDPYFKAFFLELQARNKAKMQALIAVARKMLHAIFGLFKHGSKYDGQTLFPQLAIPSGK